jgi:hypothetical protein
MGGLFMQCSVCKAENSAEAVFCQKCGARLARKPPPVDVEVAESTNEAEVRVRRRPAEMEEPESPVLPRRRRVIVEEEDDRPSGGAIVPYRNPLALFGYYCVFLGFIVGIGATTAVVFFASQSHLEMKHISFGKTVIYIGFIVGMILELSAFLLGIFGLLYVRTHPTARGTGHAVMSVILGPVLLIAELVALLLLIGWIDSQFHG